MRLTSTDILFGVTAPVLRDLLRGARDSDRLWLHDAIQILGADEAATRAVLAELEQAGHISVTDDERGLRFTTEISGNAIAGAKFVKPISRARAEQSLTAFL